ncbi:hypothetical protein QZJ86_06225 [Methylomonas montana]|uniref:hypothetical protein n=1 Tax=Methylomonas montana TaxID=3058963 RepID=UPI002657F05C|nr:hypothetical protein [Methylomonas montana]WKJ91731.1 hypothetical protein QZJ86_06225 [Methylomonas montana]
MRPIKMHVGAKPIGDAITWAYPDGGAEYYLIPTYELTVAGTESNGAKSKRTFEVIRFGVHQKGKLGKPVVVGLANHQVHTIKAWLPHYTVHSASSPEKGAWQVYESFLIHDGPDDPHRQVYASIGCIEICGGPNGFVDFNDYIINLSGPKASNRADQLAEIGAARSMSIEYAKTNRPALKRYP